jgi:hypothetical protein
MRLAVIGFLLVVTLPLLGQPRPKQQEPSHREQNDSKTSDSAGTNLIIVNQQPSTSEKQDGAKHNSSQWPPPTDPFWSNWALVFVALGTGIAAALNLSAIRNQTEAVKAQTTEVSDSTEKQVQSLRNIERAWVVGVVDNDSKLFRLYDPLYRVPEVWMGIKNAGHTPGKLITVSARFEKVGDLKSLPPEPYFGIDCIKPFGDDLVIPGEPVLWLSGKIDGGQPLTDEEKKDVAEGKLFLLCWGEIQYTNVVTGEQHMTRLCFQYTYGVHPIKSAFQVCFDAPASYRKTT